MTVLRALQDAEDSLSCFGNRRQALASLARVKASADRAADLTRQRYRAGTASLTDSLDTENQRVSAEEDLSNALAALTGDYIGLQKPLALGWLTRRVWPPISQPAVLRRGSEAALQPISPRPHEAG